MIPTDKQSAFQPILYSFRRCPYAMRARMALYISCQAVVLREVSLKNKPSEMIALSPKGTVPVLHLDDGNVLDESVEIMLWTLNKEDPQNWLQPSYGSLHTSLALIRENDCTFKGNLDLYKYGKKSEGVDPIYYRGEGEEFLRILEEMLSSNKYLFGPTPSIADYAIVPFVRQYANTDREWFAGRPYIKLIEWLNRLLSSNLFEASMIKYPVWSKGDSPIMFSP